MRKIFGMLCMVLFLMAGLSFAQEVPAAQPAQQEDQPLVFELFGTSWYPLSGKVLQSFDDLGVKVLLVWARDMNGTAGMVELLLIIGGDPNNPTCQIFGGWIQPYSVDEQGFYLQENGDLSGLMNKKGDTGDQLEWRGINDKDGNPILEFYLKKKDGSEEILRDIDIKKFVAEYFKNPQK